MVLNLMIYMRKLIYYCNHAHAFIHPRDKTTHAPDNRIYVNNTHLDRNVFTCMLCIRYASPSGMCYIILHTCKQGCKSIFEMFPRAFASSPQSFMCLDHAMHLQRVYFPVVAALNGVGRAANYYITVYKNKPQQTDSTARSFETAGR